MTVKIEQEQQPPVETYRLPKGWAWARLGDLALVRLGKTPRKTEYRNRGDYKIVKFRDVRETGKIDWDNDEKGYVDLSPGLQETLQELEDGDVLVTASAHMSEHIGKKVGLVPIVPKRYKRAFVVGELLQIRTKESVDPKWLFYYLGSTEGYKAIQKRVHGVHLISSRAQHIEIPLAPLNQQQRIVAEIEKQFSRLDEAVASLKRVMANLKRYKAAVLKAAAECKLVPIENQETSKIGEVAELVTKGSSPNWQGFDYSQTGIIFVRSQNVGWGKLDLSDVAHLPIAFNAKERKSVLKAGDVLLNIVGASIGRAAVATTEIEGGNVNQAVAVIRLNQKRILPAFLMLHLLSPGAQAAIHAEKVDVARANISLSDIKEFSVLAPPLTEQAHIVSEVERRLSVIEELEATVVANLTRADRLRQGVLGKAFCGQLVLANYRTLPR